jgi:hypothetical protein
MLIYAHKALSAIGLGASYMLIVIAYLEMTGRDAVSRE